ncbi:MAG: hypothetical protein ABIR92_05960 [Gemmatimonadaceae bacterium]
MLDCSDVASEREHRLYVQLADLHRRAGMLLSDAARAMIDAKDLPIGCHVPPDVEGVTKMREAYARFVRVESELRDLLTGRLARKCWIRWAEARPSVRAPSCLSDGTL